MTLETANRLYELRKKHNLSQEELAEKLGVSRQAVSKWERSEASPDTDNIIALAKIYGLTLDELIYGEKEVKEEAKEEAKEESNENTSSESKENVCIDIEDGEDKVKISSDGILVEEKNGNTVKINISGKIMEKVIKKIEDKIDDDDDDENEDEDDDDDEEEDVGVLLKKEDGHYKVQVKKTKVKTRFWLEIPYPIICTIAYLIFGFYDICGGWALSWIIYVTIPIYYSFVEAIYKRRFSEFAYPVFAACIYLYLGMYHGNWHPSWIIFVTIPVYYCIADALDRTIKRKQHKT